MGQSLCGYLCQLAWLWLVSPSRLRRAQRQTLSLMTRHALFMLLSFHIPGLTNTFCQGLNAVGFGNVVAGLGAVELACGR